MSQSNAGLDISRPAAADLSAKQYYGVKIDSNGRAAVVAAAGEVAIGVLQNDPDAQDRAATVRIMGTTKVVAGGTVAKGDLLKFDANGKAVAASKATVNTSDAGAASDAVIGSYVWGQALESAAANEIFEALILHAGAIATTAA